MLLTIAMADAYSAGFEFEEDEYVRKHHCLTKYHQRESDKTVAGCYTNDTQMSIVIAELMVNERGPWNEYLVAEYFVKAFKRDSRETYSPEFFEFLRDTETAAEFIENINS